MIFRFADCILDTGRHEFRRGGEVLHLEPQVFALLHQLVEANGALVTKDELIDTVWQGLNVSDATISARISAARAAVGDNGKAQAVIRTVPKSGIRLVSAVDHSGEAPSSPASPALSRGPDIAFTRSGDGHGIAWAQHGTGPPLLRAGHWLSHLELDRSSPVWQPLLDRLESRFTLLRYDQRGTGLSDRDPARLDLEVLADDLRAVADAAGFVRFPIFAASQAVPVALLFAARHPERVSRLVLYGGYAQGRLHRPRAPGDPDQETMLGLIRAGWGQPDSALAAAFATLFVPDATADQLADFVRLQDRSISPQGAARLRATIDEFDVSASLAEIRAPTLVVHARQDAIQPLEQGRRIAEGVPNARFMMLESRNHVPLPQDPAWERLMQATEEFCLIDG